MKILLIEDNSDHRVLIQDTFFSAYPDDIVNIRFEETLELGLVALADDEFDIFLCDLKLVDSTVENTVKQLQNLKLKIPIIVLTSLHDSEIAKKLVKHGIQDYLPKGELSPSLLRRSCLYAVERIQQKNQLENQNKDMQAFCNSLSHDFKASLRRISQFSSLLYKNLNNRIDFTDAEEECFKLLLGNTSEIQRLVEGLHQYLLIGYSSDSPGWEVVDLNKVLARVDSLIREGEKDDYEIEIDKMPKISGSESQLFILFHNLIVNGIKYNNNKPKIKIISDINDDKKQCNITVEDNGIGINHDLIDLIYLPFKRLHNKQEFQGSGLGLSIVKRIIEKHKGNITVDSTPNLGSRFIVTLPIGG